jgi:hypothetical protein
LLILHIVFIKSLYICKLGRSRHFVR